MAQYTYKTVAHPYALPSAIRRSHQPFVTAPLLLICKPNFFYNISNSSCLYYCNSSLIFSKSTPVICKEELEKASNLYFIFTLLVLILEMEYNNICFYFDKILIFMVYDYMIEQEVFSYA